MTEEFAITVVDYPSFNPTWSPAADTDGYYALNTDYTLNLNYVNDYYDSFNDFTYTYTVSMGGVDKTFSVLKSASGQNAVLNFNMPGEYHVSAVVKYRSTVIDTCEFTCRAVGGKVAMRNAPDEPTLNTPYSFDYYYWHPEHPNVTYEFKMSEVAFDQGGEENMYYQFYGDNSFMISFLDYGCYYIEATVKDGIEICDRKIINFTKLYRPENCGFNLYSVVSNLNQTALLFKYNLQVGTSPVLPERFFGFIQKVKETRRAFYIAAERRVDREFVIESEPIFMGKGANALSVLPDGGFRKNSDPNDPYEFYVTYNGYIHYPMDGVRSVSTTDPKKLPMDMIKYEVVNSSSYVGL